VLSSINGVSEEEDTSDIQPFKKKKICWVGGKPFEYHEMSDERPDNEA